MHQIRRRAREQKDSLLDRYVARFGQLLDRNRVEIALRIAKENAEAAAEAAQAANQAKSEFLAVASHELRTPLTSVIGSLGLMRGGAVGELSGQAQEMIDIAYKNSDRLIYLINNILDIERIESGRMELELEPVDITELVKRSLEDNKAYADQYDVSFVFVRMLPRLKVQGDAEKLTQVLTNLLSNAAKFSHPGDQVEIAITRHGGSIRVTVKDHGPGIPPKFQDRVFEKFTQVDASDSRQRGGSGLGLSICKAIVEQHGGAMGIDSECGKGTTFFFDLPIAGPQLGKKPAAAEDADKPCTAALDRPTLSTPGRA